MGLWPGLPGLWAAGRGRDLMLALGFAWALSVLLLATFLAPQHVPDAALAIGWMLWAFAWCAAAGWALRRRPADPRPAGAAGDQDLFIRAQAEYLKGHWLEAEMLAEQLMAHNADDAEASLLLSSVFRRTRRVAESRRQLAALERTTGGGNWRLEIEQERRLLDSLERLSSGSTRREPSIQPDTDAKLTDAA